ncbi:ESX-1 secretion-associated protein EspI [Mycobacteroides abscessus subsp. abscessus]|nr:AAA family ATPase [Mycobacteroides abscessus]SHR30607.1 ESX-1 secretion-associated protein EspI [Mycobacteroides abscessus subsp. abscessus]
MAKKKPTAEPDEGSIARPPWLSPPEKERRWSLSGLGSKKKDQREPAHDREAPQVVDLDDDDDQLAEGDDQVVEPAAAAPETSTVEDVEADRPVASADVDEPVSSPVPAQTDDAIVVAPSSESGPVASEPVDAPWEMVVPAWGEVSAPAASSSALDRVDDAEVPASEDDAIVVAPSSESGPVASEPASEQVGTPRESETPSVVEPNPVSVGDAASAWGPLIPLAESESIDPEPVVAESDRPVVPVDADEQVDVPVPARTDEAIVVAPSSESGPVASEPVDAPWVPEVSEISSVVEPNPVPVEDAVSAWGPLIPLAESESIDPEPASADVDESVSLSPHAQVDDAVVVSSPAEPEPVPEFAVSGRVDTPWEREASEVPPVGEAAAVPVEDVVSGWDVPAPLAESESSEPQPVASESELPADAPELDEVEMRAAALLDAVARARESAVDSVSEPATEADGLGQVDEQLAEAADSDVPQAEPSVDVPAADEIDQRAAALLAAMDAKRSQSAASEPGSTDPTEQDPAPRAEPEQHEEQAPDLSLDSPTELGEVRDLPETADFNSGDVESDRPFEGEANHTTGPDAAAQDPYERHDIAQGSPEHIDEDIPDVEPLDEDVQSQRPPARRLALPPWQLPGAARSVEFERFGPHKPSSLDDDDGPFPRLRRDHDKRDHADKVAPEKPPAEPLNESPESVVRDAPQAPMQDPRLRPPPPPPGWRQRLPPPPPGWRPPLPPPPPPGWTANRPIPGIGHPGPPPGPPPQEHRAAPPANYRPPQAFRVPTPLEEAELTGQHPNAPQSGWRRRVRMATGGHINPGLSRRDRLRQELEEQIRQPIVGDFRIAVLSIKGGVGKTTTTLGLGSALAMVRHDRVIAVDANPDRGTLAERVRDESTQSTVRDLLSDPNLHSYADVRNHTLMATSRLEILASEQEPAVSEVFSEGDYRRTVEILRHYYNIILTDCGTGIMHSAMAGVLDLAHTIVLVSAPAMDAARSASATLDWLMQHGYSGLVRGARVVLSTSRPGSANLKIDKLYEHFESRCRSVHTIPFDPHLSEGADIDFGLLRQQTMDAYLDLAASVSEDFGRLRGPAERQ